MKFLLVTLFALLTVVCIYAACYAAFMQNAYWYGFPNFVISLLGAIVFAVATASSLVGKG